MKVCEICSSEIPEKNCPACTNLLGTFLTRPLGELKDQQQVALETMRNLDSKWGMHSFAPGWRLVDLGARVVLIMVVVALSFWLYNTVQNRHNDARIQMATHDEFIQETLSKQRPLIRVEVAEVAENYSRLSKSTSDQIESHRVNGMVHVAILLALLGLLVSQAIGKYRGHKEHSKLKATVAFLCSSAGQRFILEQVQRAEKTGSLEAAQQTQTD